MKRQLDSLLSRRSFLKGSSMALPFIAATRGILNAQEAGIVNIPEVTVERPDHQIRGYFKLVDSNGDEVNKVVRGNPYILESRIHIPNILDKSVVNFNADIDLDSMLSKGLTAFDTRSFEGGEHYSSNDIFCSGEYCPDMHDKFNLVEGSFVVRSTVPGSISGLEREGVRSGDGLLAKWNIRFGGSVGEAVDYASVSYGNLVAAESDGTNKHVATRDLLVSVVPQGYEGVALTHDTASRPYTDENGVEYRVNGRERAVPFVTVGGEWNALLQRANGANGAYEDVKLIDKTGPYLGSTMDFNKVGNVNEQGVINTQSEMYRVLRVPKSDVTLAGDQ